ncbi:MAG TPA: pantoate--beta-alanine ligase [Actinomycetota bacterium]|nr:pantoate--beta-alanine ligase [Actinomycetota bacterium]
MRLVETKAALRALLDADRRNGKRVGFVPTMGYLHEGHAGLIRAARAECDVVVVSIFVNPLQFGANEDLGAYPRDLDRDLAVCKAEGADYVLHPTVDEMYGKDSTLRITVGPIGDVLCGASRPGHFDGVATVVAKLFNIAGPCRAYFGEKDAQQLVVIRRLADTLDFPVEIVGCATVREPDGLAMSSRNTYLKEDERTAAAVLSRALFEARDAIERQGERDGAKVARLIAERISSEPLATLDYAACVNPHTLEDVSEITGRVLLAAAARIGNARLIDNTTATAPAAPSGG